MKIWKIIVIIVLILPLLGWIWTKQNPAQFNEMKWNFGIFIKHLKVEAQMPLLDSYRKMMPTLFEEILPCEAND